MKQFSKSQEKIYELLFSKHFLSYSVFFLLSNGIFKPQEIFEFNFKGKCQLTFNDCKFPSQECFNLFNVKNHPFECKNFFQIMESPTVKQIVQLTLFKKAEDFQMLNYLKGDIYEILVVIVSSVFGKDNKKDLKIQFRNPWIVEFFNDFFPRIYKENQEDFPSGVQRKEVVEDMKSRIKYLSKEDITFSDDQVEKFFFLHKELILSIVDVSENFFDNLTKELFLEAKKNPEIVEEYFKIVEENQKEIFNEIERNSNKLLEVDKQLVKNYKKYLENSFSNDKKLYIINSFSFWRFLNSYPILLNVEVDEIMIKNLELERNRQKELEKEGKIRPYKGQNVYKLLVKGEESKSEVEKFYLSGQIDSYRFSKIENYYKKVREFENSLNDNLEYYLQQDNTFAHILYFVKTSKDQDNKTLEELLNKFKLIDYFSEKNLERFFNWVEKEKISLPESEKLLEKLQEFLTTNYKKEQEILR